jgi:hypothetical protein
MTQVRLTRTTVIAALMLLAIVMLTIFVALFTIFVARADEGDDGPPKLAAFRPWQRIWQCNDIRVTETVNQPGVVNYDLGGTI